MNDLNLLAAIAFTLFGVVVGAIAGMRFILWMLNRGMNIALCVRCYKRIREDWNWKALRQFPHTSCPDCEKVLVFHEGDPVGPPLHTLLDSFTEEQGLRILDVLRASQLVQLRHVVEIVNQNHDLWVRTAARSSRRSKAEAR